VPVGEERLYESTLAGIASAVSPDGKTLLSAASDQTEATYSVKVRKWDRESGRELPGWSQELGKLVPHGLTISPNGATVACATNTAYLWEAAAGKEVARIAGMVQAFSPDGKVAASASVPRGQGEPATFTLWEAATGKELCSTLVPEGRVQCLLFSPDGRMLATVSQGDGNPQGAIHLWPLVRDESQKSRVRV